MIELQKDIITYCFCHKCKFDWVIEHKYKENKMYCPSCGKKQKAKQWKK